jgi:hypothetical protein
VTGPHARRSFDWEAAGHTLGESLDGYTSLVVVGIDPVTTGHVAIGIGRAQAFKRRVAVGDLFAESPPIQELVHTDDPHGLVDSFLYGVSLTKIAYEVPDAGQLFVMPSGTEPPDYEEILPNPRWHRLTAGFQEVGALLILAAPASAPRLEELVAATGGAVLVGEAVPRKLPVAAVVASVRDPKGADLVAKPASEAAPAITAPAATTEQQGQASLWTRVRTRISQRRAAAIGGIVLTLVLAAVAAWLAYRPLAGESARLGPKPDSAHPTANVLAATPDSAARDSSSDSTASGALLATPRVANPADSAQAAAFGVELMAANTQAGAILKLQQDGKALPAATFAPVLIQGARWFKVIGGAYATRAGADSLLAALGQQKKLLGGESVVRLPYAFLIDSGVSPTAVPAMIEEYANSGRPIYGLLQPNGKAWLLAGAFESPEQSAMYAESLRAAGTTPVLVYRKGRTF